MNKKILTVVGDGNQGYSGDGGLSLRSQMDNPFHVELDPSGRFLYFADCFNFRIRKADLTTGIVENFAGTGNQGHSGDGGSALQADIDEIYAIQVDQNGDVYICQRFNPSIRKIDYATGIISTVAGTSIAGSGGDGIPANISPMIEPNDCVLDGKGGLLIADVQDQKVRLLDLQTGIISTFAGTGNKEHTGDGGPVAEAGIFEARAICVDKKGNTYICEREGNTIRRVDGNGVITTVAGTGETGYQGDGGPAAEALLNGPKAIRCDLDGNVLVVDTENHCIRLIDTSANTISTVAGGSEGPHGDGGPATDAGMARPHGVVAGLSGEFYVADSENHRVRMVK
jgi:DNA-binding beta-propeller fold protein YncE